MTVEQLKEEAAKLPADARVALADWIELGHDVRALRHDELLRQVRDGVEQADQGMLLESDEVFTGLRAGQR